MKKTVFVLIFIFMLFGFCFAKGGQEDADRESGDTVWKQLRADMVEIQIKARGIHDPDVLKAMRIVPRHLFCIEEYRTYAYSNNALPINYGQTISQPYIVALMTELLELEEGDKVLEIGTGSGYQAAVLAQLTDQVYTIEIIEGLAWSAKKLYDILGYDQIRTKTADGYFGWEDEAPFDAIIVTAAAGHIPSPLIEQLKPGGRLIIPVGSPFEVQILMKIVKHLDGSLTAEQVLPVRFVPLTGTVDETDR